MPDIKDLGLKNPIRFWKGRMIVAAVQHKMLLTTLTDVERRIEGSRRAVQSFAKKLYDLGVSDEEIDELLNCIPDEAGTLDFTVLVHEKRGKP